MTDYIVRDVDGRELLRVAVQEGRSELAAAVLEGADLQYAQLSGVDMRDADLYWALLHDADLSGANLERACLRGATLDGAVLRGANLMHADLGTDNLGGSTSLLGTDLRDTELRWTNLAGAAYDETTLFPKGFDPQKAGLRLRRSRLTER